MGRGFFQGRHTTGQQVHETMLNISNQRNANENHNQISPYTCQNGCYQKNKRQQVLRMIRRKGKPFVLSVRMQIRTASTKNGMNVPQKIKIVLVGTTMLSSNHTSEYISEKNYITISKRQLYSHAQYSIIHSSQDS